MKSTLLAMLLLAVLAASETAFAAPYTGKEFPQQQIETYIRTTSGGVKGALKGWVLIRLDSGLWVIQNSFGTFPLESQPSP